MNEFAPPGQPHRWASVELSLVKKSMAHPRATLLLIVTTVLAGCMNSSPKKPTSAQSQVEDSRYAVYSVLISEFYPKYRNKRLVVESQTSIDEQLSGDTNRNLNYVRDKMQDDVTQEILDDFRTKNQQPQSLSCRFNSNAECLLITKDQLDELSRTADFWTTFYEKYQAGSITTFSRVGFNREMDKALVYTGDRCGWKCGMGYYVLLIKWNNSWAIKYKLNMWAS